MADGITSLNDPKRLEARHKADEFLRSLGYLRGRPTLVAPR